MIPTFERRPAPGKPDYPENFLFGDNSGSNADNSNHNSVFDRLIVAIHRTITLDAEGWGPKVDLFWETEMKARGVSVRVAIISVALIVPRVAQPISQDGSTLPPDAKRDLLAVIESDESKGEWVFYHQRFLDSDNQWVQYQGSVYAAVQKMKIETCKVDMETVIVDHFAGTVGKTGTGQQQDTSTYDISFTLTPEIAKQLQVVEARPAQLRRTTHAICDEKPSCELTWVRIESAGRKITERITTNDQIEFSGQASTAVLPVSSSDVGSAVIKYFQVLANSGCH